MMRLMVSIRNLRGLGPLKRRRRTVRLYHKFIFIYRIIFCKRFCRRKLLPLMVKAGIDLYVQGSYQQDACEDKLFSHKLQEGGSLLNHLSTFKEIVSDLNAMEVKFDDEDLALMLLCSLPPLYSNFRDTILYSYDTLTLSEVYEALHAKEKMKLMVSSESSNMHGEALQVRGRSEKKKSNNGPRGKSSNGYRGRSKSRGKDKFCRYCKKENHDISKCYTLKNKEKRNGTYKTKGKFDEEGNASIATNDSTLMVKFL